MSFFRTLQKAKFLNINWWGADDFIDFNIYFPLRRLFSKKERDEWKKLLAEEKDEKRQNILFMGDKTDFDRIFMLLENTLNFSNKYKHKQEAVKLVEKIKALNLDDYKK